MTPLQAPEPRPSASWTDELRELASRAEQRRAAYLRAVLRAVDGGERPSDESEGLAALL